MPDTFEQRTGAQNRSLYRWFQMIAAQCNEAGLDMQLILSKQMDIPVTKDNFKECVWRPAQIEYLSKISTTELNKGKDIDKVRDILIRHFAKEFKMTLPPFPRISDVS